MILLITFISLVYRSGYISSRSERSDYERDYRDTPPRVGGNPGGVSGSSRRRNSRDVDYGGQDYDYQRRDKRSDRLKESRHGKYFWLILGNFWPFSVIFGNFFH